MTGLQKLLPMEEMRAVGWLKPDDTPLDIFKTPAQGAATGVWATTALALKGHDGLYLEDCRQGLPADPTNPWRGSRRKSLMRMLAEDLWAASEALVTSIG